MYNKPAKMDHCYYSQMFCDENTDDQFEPLDQTDHPVDQEDTEKGTDEILIDAVRGYPHLYNSSLKEYKDTQMKENSWTEIALLMNMSVASCQNRWLRLRERFTKEQRLQEAETRSGSGLSRRQKFTLYKNMSFLGNYIKRRKSYTNVKDPAVKNGTDSTSASSFDECNFTTNREPRQFISNIHLKELSSFTNPFSHGSSSNADSNVMPKQLETRPTNFPCTSYTQNTNRLQTEQNQSICTRTLQEQNMFQTRSENLSPPPRNESRNSCITQEQTRSENLSPPPRNESRNSCITQEQTRSESSSPPARNESRNSCITQEQTRSESSSPLPRNESRNSFNMSQKIANSLISRDCIPSPALQTNVRSMKNNMGKIKNKSNSHLESSLATLSDTLQNRIVNKLPTSTEQLLGI